jgi:hypothetical protein
VDPVRLLEFHLLHLHPPLVVVGVVVDMLLVALEAVVLDMLPDLEVLVLVVQVDAMDAQVFNSWHLYHANSFLGSISFTYDISYEVKHECDPCKKVNNLQFNSDYFQSL